MPKRRGSGPDRRVGRLWDDLSVRDLDDYSSTDSGPEPPVRPSGFAGGLVGRNVDIAALSLVLLFGIWLLVAGLQVVSASPLWGFTYDGAFNGVLSQLAVTGPAAVLMAAATTANVLAGAVVLRLLGAPAFHRLSDLALAGFAGAVVLDAATLFLLGSVGLFGWPELLILHTALAAAYAATRRKRPLLAVPVHVRISRPAAWWLLVLAIWAGPVILQLASPTVPFMDVLPNHVAPVEHIRVFGSFSTLTTSPSPIYGPSRLMLGYVAFLGQLTTITNLDAVLAEAAFALPLTVLIALAIRRLAGELFGGSASYWVLLTFPLTFTFMRIPDSRGTVLVFPLGAWVLCTVAAELRSRARRVDPDGRRDGAPAGGVPADGNGGVAGGNRGAAIGNGGATGQTAPAHPRLPDLALAFALGAAILVHPVVGLVAFAAAGGALILYPTALARRLIPALVGGLVLAVPQALTMGDIAAPAWVGAIFVVAGVGTAFGLAFAFDYLAARVSKRPAALMAAAGRYIDADAARAAFLAAAIVLLLIWAHHIVPPSVEPHNPTDPTVELMLDFPHLIWLSLAGAALSIMRLGRGWIVLGCGIVAGLAEWAGSGLIGSANLTELAVHYEVPKSVEYWLPVMLAIGAAGAIAAMCRLRWLRTVRPAAIALMLMVAVYPTTQPLATDLQIGEHRASESVGLALREAELGYWTFNGYPDTRNIIDAPRQQVVDELRAEETAGRLGPSTRVLNIAWWFQEWVAVPIGAFTGAMETSISLYPELSIHTVGGRLLGFDALDQELASDYGYVVLEPADLSPDLIAYTESHIAADGYREIWSNSQANVYARR